MTPSSAPLPSTPRREGPFFVHTASGKTYFVHGTALDVTNARDGSRSVVYSPCYESKLMLFVRAKDEFFSIDSEIPKTRFQSVGSFADAVAAGLLKAEDEAELRARLARVFAEFV